MIDYLNSIARIAGVTAEVSTNLLMAEMAMKHSFMILQIFYWNIISLSARPPLTTGGLADNDINY